MPRILAALAITWGMLLPVGHLAAEPQRTQPSVASDADARAVIDQYCVTCHSDRAKAGGFSLQSLDLTDVGANSAPLEKVVRKLRLGAMPPVGLPRPPAQTYTALASWFETELDSAAASKVHPGRTETLHRLNRAEYTNAIRDLLHLEGVDLSLMLPTDDASYGFDNIAGILGMSPTHLDRYLGAARKLSRIAVGDITMAPDGETRMIPPDLSQEGRLEDLPFGTRGGTRISRYFPVDGEYIIRFQAHTGTGISEKEDNYIELSVDGRQVFFEKMQQRPVAATGNASDVRADTDWEVRTSIQSGLRDLTVTFVKTTSAEAEDILRPYLRPPGVSSFRLTRMGGYGGPYVAQVSILGPFNVTGVGDTPSRQRIFVCRPATDAEEMPCARTILSTLTRRAYRRPVEDADLDRLLGFYTEGRASGGFDRGIQMALERVLASPEFLFRIERDPSNVAPGSAYRISDLELASRLSFFLWSSIPDDDLLEAAGNGTLRAPGGVERQVRRMLADPKAEALVSNFVGQWLRLRNVQATDPNTRMFPDYDETLRRAFRRETELLAGSIFLKEDRSVLDILDADYTFLNERLARHYGIPNVYGSRFRRVTLADNNRRGLLGQGSILTVTSQATRTSPVVRGKWILESLLGAPPPAPPPNVPALEDTVLKGTLRQRMEQHRKNPVCASCHKMMDPLGFALENFDAVGAWRTEDAGLPVDSTGMLLDGTTFDGVVGLRTALRGQASDMFVMTLTERLMTYALGRGVDHDDMPALRAIAGAASRDGYRFSSLILNIVSSVPFQMRQSESPAAVTTTAGR